jgi:hypothetical protein
MRRRNIIPKSGKREEEPRKAKIRKQMRIEQHTEKREKKITLEERQTTSASPHTP